MIYVAILRRREVWTLTTFPRQPVMLPLQLSGMGLVFFQELHLCISFKMSFHGKLN